MSMNPGQTTLFFASISFVSAGQGRDLPIFLISPFSTRMSANLSKFWAGSIILPFFMRIFCISLHWFI